ncbi:peptide-methionine (S)-S-oxide reductase MsrA [Imperialibacter roseus]|uniref:Peptide methionine sulfoxide reductase MsrA n=1 Tax=Imperialibacter roseus TaxID=1324217 RepID=A0ABZ0ITV1_9BACT|nr:peptide-methionine (S)-S-oxide reductase MsrA [Imperialibacter roseus]WOK08458.1 peptide-methionine (S)-S-oxide reductase MsrA [Imperialibacter roseus]|tara:strand:+ start:5741 stop:6391 length:651 start_codon:yes stop_codon:yes gene_type:complete
MRNTLAKSALFIAILGFYSCDAQKSKNDGGVRQVELKAPAGKAIAAFAEGCFWCSEHIFEAVVGVDSAVSGYAGGHTKNPTYELVNTETTGHAETVLVYYDPSRINYEELTKVFFTSQDPTTKDRQGPDVGNSYRSILFYLTPEEKAIAEKSLKTFDNSGMFSKPIVSEIMELKAFYRAEEYHQDYIEHNPGSGYVRGVSIPRYEKFKRTYKGKLK